MAIQYYMTFCITFRDRAEFDLAVAVCGGGPTCVITPQAAGILFGLGPNVASWPTGDVSTVSKFGWFTFPWGVGQELRFPGPSGVFTTENQLSYNVPCQPGTPASIWPCPGDGSHDAIFTWALSINFEGSFSTGPTPPPAANPIPQRRWIGGAELTNQLEGGSGSNNASYTRDASRTIEGIGYALRGANTTGLWNKTVAQYRTGLTSHTSWERFYWRPRRQGIANIGIWKCNCSAGASAGGWLRWNATGELRALQNTNFGVVTDMGTVIATPTIGTWYRIDILLKYGDGTANSGRQRILINGVDAFSYSDALNNSM